MAIANCLTLLRSHTGHGTPEPEVQALAADFDSLSQRMPTIPSARIQREIGQINDALTTGLMTDEEVEQCCRMLLEDDGLRGPQRLELRGFLTEVLGGICFVAEQIDDLLSGPAGIPGTQLSGAAGSLPLPRKPAPR
ncbi:hypothetical protein ACFZCL_30705 [Streptomyces sp. NPDC008159]|uniref:hypothetical protein n=1 Tax=Streptomyces sp. NPDC008159 TaxID=3364817 RepID=UPI0036EAB56F